VARARRRERAWMLAVAASLAALAVVSYRWYPRPSAAPEPIAFTIEPPPGEQLPIGPGLLSVSPDGRRLAFVTGSTGTGAGGLWIRDLDSLVSRPVPRVTNPWQPAWSPDNRSIAITEPGGRSPLRTVDIATGLTTTIAPEANGRAAWSQRGVILFSDGTRLFRVPERGGTPPVVAMDLDASRQEVSLAWPLFLPDGRRYVFLARSNDSSKNGLFLAALDSSARTFLVNAFSSVEYAGGYLFYVRDNAVVAHPFDADAGRFTGEAFSTREDVQYNALNGRATTSVSTSGVLAYRKGDRLSAEGRRVMMFDRSGKGAKQIGPAGPYFRVTISPDGRQAVVEEQGSEDNRRHLSLLDVERGLSSRFTVADVDERNPVWSPDGSSVIFTSTRDGAVGLYRRSAAGGATAEERLFSARGQLEASGVSPDGTLLLFTQGITSGMRVWAMPLTGERTPVEAIPGVAMAQTQATFSPDGKWIAYCAIPGPAAGEIYIQPYPADDRRVRISPASGRYPFWTADGKHIVYRTTNDDMMSVELTPSGNTFRAGPAVKLFTAPRLPAGTWIYSMDARGERFLMAAPPERAASEIAQPLTVIVNWVANLKRP
jgi:Tol biopolymer transport system component